MKRILALTFCLGLGLATVVHADDKDKKHAKREAKAAGVSQHNAVRAAKQNANYQRSLQHGARIQQRTLAHQNQNALRFQRQKAKIQQNNNAEISARNWKHGNRNTIVANQDNPRNWKRGNHNTIVGNQNNPVVRQHNNVTVRNRNSWYEASRRFNWRERHDRSWWRHHHGNTRFVLFGGGYYFWDNNYWYPAYGYDPAYSRYTYDEPIYGYNNYDPGQVISNVQIQLQNEGYYDGEVDGQIGPMTREALARYQADHGLYVTRAIDEPTLEALGLS
jgi:putative peptidoglycan binding protein